MTVRTFLLGALVAATLFWGIWALVINWIDPGEARAIGFLVFFLTFFLAVAATAAFIGYGMRRVVSPSQFAAYRVRTSLRQGVWLGLFLDLLLFLQLQRLLYWWVTVIVIVLFLSLEFLFLTYDKSVRRHSRTEETGDTDA